MPTVTVKCDRAVCGGGGGGRVQGTYSTVYEVMHVGLRARFALKVDHPRDDGAHVLLPRSAGGGCGC
jgi:hypothetical protein